MQIRRSSTFTMHAQRLLLARRPLMPEYSLSQLSAMFPVNGTSIPPGDYYKRLVDGEFRDWKLTVHGLVHRPLARKSPYTTAMRVGAQSEKGAEVGGKTLTTLCGMRGNR